MEMSLPNPTGYQVYQKNKYETASPHKLISLLYGALLTNLKRSMQALDEGKTNIADTTILKSQDIISELMACINEEQGGEIASNLKQLYFYCYNQLVQAKIHKNKSNLQEVLEYVTDLKQAWDSIGKEVGLHGAR